MKVLVACEFSGIVRDAFIARGYDAISCDLLPTERPTTGPHYQCDVRDLIGPSNGFDLMIAHPPCTHLATSGARWFKDKVEEQLDAIEFVKLLLGAPIPRIALENPVGVLSTKVRKPDQIIQPYEFGVYETKATCLWLKNLPKLRYTNHVGWLHAKPVVHYVAPSPDRWKIRSRTYPEIAAAMADQWGK